MPKNELIKKPNEIIHLGVRLSFEARKIFNAFLYHAYPTLLDQDIHKLKLADLYKLIGCKTKNREYLTSVLKELMATLIELIEFEGKANEKWIGSTLVASAQIEKGTCEYSFSPHLRKLLYRPDFYTRFYLEIQRRLKSYHSLSLYENTKRFEKVRSTGWISVDSWRKLLGVDDSIYYQTFKNLSRQVINPSVKEINKYSDIIITPEYKRESRRIVSIRFLIKENPQFTLWQELPQEKAPLPFSDPEQEEQNKLFDEAVSKLTSEQRTELEEVFEREIVNKSITLKNRFKTVGFASPTIQHEFQIFVLNTFNK